LDEQIVEPGARVRATAKVELGEDPDFAGSLLLEAIGHTRGRKPADVAFRIGTKVNVGLSGGTGTAAGPRARPLVSSTNRERRLK
jgi:hypothetical protein